MKFLTIALAFCAFMCIVSSQRTNDNRRGPHVRRLLRRPSGGQNSERNVLSPLAQLRPSRRTFSPRTGLSKSSSLESRTRPRPFGPSKSFNRPQFEDSSEDIVPYQPRPEFRPQNAPEDVAESSDFMSEKVREISPEGRQPVIDKSKPVRPAVYAEGSRLFRKPNLTHKPSPFPKPTDDILKVSEEGEHVEVLRETPSKPQRLPTHERQSQFTKFSPPIEVKPLKVADLRNTEEVKDEYSNTPNIFDFSKEIQPFSKEVDQFYTQSKPQQPPKPIRPSFQRDPKPPRLLAEESLTKVPKRKKVIPQNFGRFEKEFKKDKRETIPLHGGIVDPNGAQFAQDLQKVENAGNKQGRISFQLHGLQGPHSYKFGFDTGKGHNRQFRFEERDNYGEVKGRYGYIDKHGKLHVVNYSAHPKHGFSADVPHY